MRNLVLVYVLALCTFIALCANSSPRTVHMPQVQIAAVDAEATLKPLVLALLAAYPLNADAIVEVVPIPGYLGRTWWDEELGKYHIQIVPSQSVRGQQDSLIHEWAHAMVWDASQRSEDQGHGALWGVSYARCYRVLLTVIAPK